MGPIAAWIPLIAAAVSAGAGAVESNQANIKARRLQDAGIKAQEDLQANQIAADKAQAAATPPAASTTPSVAEQVAARNAGQATIGNAGVSPDFWTSVMGTTSGGPNV